MLQIKPEYLDTPEKRAQYTVGIVGCGRVGIFHAWLAAREEFKVCCTDANRALVNNIAKGKLPFLQNEIAIKIRNCVESGMLNVTSDIKAAASQSKIIVVAVPIEIDEKEKLDYSKIESACKQVGLGLHRDSLVIIVSTVGVGVTRSLIMERLENASGLKCGVDFGLAYSPVQYSEAETLETIAKGDRIVAAFDENSLNAAAAFLERIVKGKLKKVLNVKLAEAVTLFEALQSDARYALAREFATFCEKTGVDYIEATKLKAKSVDNELPLSLFEDTSYNESYIFLENSENLDLKTRIPKVAREINAAIAKHAMDLIRDALKSCSKTVRRARITLLGITCARDAKTPPKKIAVELVKMLNVRGVRLSVYDPYLSSDEASEIANFKKSLADALEGADCAVIVTGHDEFKRLNLKELRIIMKMPAAVVDLEGVLEPFMVEKEGFVYRGFGRGVWKK